LLMAAAVAWIAPEGDLLSSRVRAIDNAMTLSRSPSGAIQATAAAMSNRVARRRPGKWAGMRIPRSIHNLSAPAFVPLTAAAILGNVRQREVKEWSQLKEKRTTR